MNIATLPQTKPTQPTPQLALQDKKKAQATIEYVKSVQPVDSIVKATDLGFIPLWPADNVGLMTPKFTELHEHALQQICMKADLPWRFAQKLIKVDHGIVEEEAWGKQLLCYNLWQIYQHKPKTKYLLRSVDGQVRGFLSDRFKRLDSRGLITAFTGSCSMVNAELYDGWHSDINVVLNTAVSKIYEPYSDMKVIYGARFKNSDFGEGAQEVMFLMVLCSSGRAIIGPDKLRKIHLGKKLNEDISKSEGDYEADQKKAASDIVERVTNTLSEHNIELMQTLVKTASETSLTDKKRSIAVELMRRLLSKKEVDDIVKTFDESEDESIPGEKTVWRLSNIVSQIAGDKENNDTKHDLQVLAGKLLVM